MGTAVLVEVFKCIADDADNFVTLFIAMTDATMCFPIGFSCRKILADKSLDSRRRIVLSP